MNLTTAILLTLHSSYGISNLADPGWPQSSYQCAICPSTTEQSAQTASALDSTSEPTATQTETTSQSSSLASETTSSASLTATSSSTVDTATTVLPSPTSTSDYSSASVSHRLPAQGIAAIAVCTTLAIAAALLLLLCVLRRRRKQLQAYSGGMSRRGSRCANDFISHGRDTYEPLISPSQSFSGEQPHLTPPLRLNDRRLLPSLLRPSSRSASDTLIVGPQIETTEQGGSGLYRTLQSSPGAKHDMINFESPTRATGARKTSSPFPSSPICAPTSNKMVPRLERMQTHTSASSEPRSSLSYTQLRSPPPVSFSFPPRTSLDTTTTTNSSPPPPIRAAHKAHHRRGTPRQPFSSTSTSESGGGGQDYHNAIINTIPGSSSSGSGSISPTRPRRPHEAPLEIPDLVTPRRNSPAPPTTTTSPPPNKSLPPPPPPPPPAPPSSSMIGIAKTTGLLHQQSREGSISLHSLARQHTRDRDSWGSWGDEDEGGTTSPAAGRMFGVAFPPVDGSNRRV